MTTLTYSSTLTTTKCWCGIHFAIPTELYEHMQRRKGDRNPPECHCPLGHTMIFTGKTEAQRERELREAADARAAGLRAEKDQLLASNRALKGVVTRTKNRVGKGVCPCCNRHFTDVERHMASKHPEYADA